MVMLLRKLSLSVLEKRLEELGKISFLKLFLFSSHSLCKSYSLYGYANRQAKHRQPRKKTSLLWRTSNLNVSREIKWGRNNHGCCKNPKCKEHMQHREHHFMRRTVVQTLTGSTYLGYKHRTTLPPTELKTNKKRQINEHQYFTCECI